MNLNRCAPVVLLSTGMSVPTEVLTNKEVAIMEHTFVWAWVDEEKGIVRARTFASDWCIPEDEANGSGSMKLATMLNREITIIHGKGSVIYARPTNNHFAEVGGYVSNIIDKIL